MCEVINGTLQLKQPRGHSLQVPDILLIVVSTIGMILNGLLLIFGKGRLPKSCAMFIFNLAAADLATALLYFIIGFRRIISSGRSLLIMVVTLTSWVTVFVSFLTLLSIAVQRYIAVVHSLWSHTKIKGQSWFYTIFLITIWLIAIIFGIVLYYRSAVTMLVMTIIAEVIIVIVIALYFKIYMSFREYRVRNQQGIFANRRSLLLNMKKEAKLSLVVSCVTGILVVAVLPNVIIIQIMASMLLSGKLLAPQCNQVLSVFNSYWAVMEMLAFGLNPVIYFWRFQITSRLSFDQFGRAHKTIQFINRRKIVPEIAIAGQTNSTTGIFAVGVGTSQANK